jgi:hypothetical protein
LVIKPLQGTYLFRMAQPRLLNRRLQHPDRFVIDAQGNGKRVAVLAAMSE